MISNQLPRTRLAELGWPSEKSAHLFTPVQGEGETQVRNG